MSGPAQPPLTDYTTVRRIVVAAAVGGIAFVVSNFLQDPLKVTLGEQLILSVLAGGVTLLSQFLAEFGQNQAEFGKSLISLGHRLEQLEQNSTRQLMDASALQTDLLTRFIRRASRITENSPELVRDLAHHEVNRVSGLMRSLSGGEEVFYDGEDREYLLGLASSARHTIVATSLVTVDAGWKSFEGGLWLNDLGARYLDIQRAATRRGVEIRRIFVFDAPEFANDPSFLRVQRLQREAGIEIRGLDETRMPEHLLDHVVDFIVFDGVLAYETTRAVRMTNAVQPVIITTRLVLDLKRVVRHRDRFDELWEAAEILPTRETGSQSIAIDTPVTGRTGDPLPAPSAGVDPAVAREDVPDAVEGVAG